MDTKKNELATPLNLVKMFPDCGLNSSQVGYAFFIGAVAGIKPQGSRTALIYIDSFKRFLAFREKVRKFDT